MCEALPNGARPKEASTESTLSRLQVIIFWFSQRGLFAR